jgi:NADPH:quinone reductase-like Zn-dependent oxidoreductase
MRALILREPGAITCETVADPSAGPRQIVVQVEFCGVSDRIATMQREQLLRPGGIRAVLGPRFELARAKEALALVQSGAAAGRVLLASGR